MAVSADYLSYVLEQLAGISGLSSRRMFGAIGLYADGAFFCVIDDDTVFLKTDSTNRDDYESRGMKRFMPYPDDSQRSSTTMGYHEVPADILEDAELLAAWARKSIAVAVAAAARKAPREAVNGRKRKRRP